MEVDLLPEADGGYEAAKKQKRQGENKGWGASNAPKSKEKEVKTSG